MTRRDHRLYQIYELVLSERPVATYPFEKREEAVQMCLDLRIASGKMYRIRVVEHE